MEEIGEKLNGNSQIQNKTEFQNLPKNPQYSEADICKSVEFWANFKYKSCRSCFNRQVFY